MAVTIARLRPNDVLGNLRMTVTDVTFDSSYPTGGEPCTAADLGLRTVFFAQAVVKTTAAAGGTVEVFYDEVNGKLVANAAAAEVASLTNLATLVVRVVAFGY